MACFVLQQSSECCGEVVGISSVGKKLGLSWAFAPRKSSALLVDQLKLRSKCSAQRICSVIKLPYVMAAETSSPQKVQLYPEKTPLISDFWKETIEGLSKLVLRSREDVITEKYEKDAKKYWDMFYKRNANRFFKDRHYLDKEWGQYFSGMGVDADPPVAQTELARPELSRTILEIGCGTGNTVYPLLAKYPQAYVYACDFSPRAVDLVKANENYDENRVKAFVCDVTSSPLSEAVALAQMDVITLVFVLSAIAPGKMPAVVRNLKSVLKNSAVEAISSLGVLTLLLRHCIQPGGFILLRDYAVGDLAQERFAMKDQQISENFYVRGDGTRAYYFSEDGLRSLFLEEGFESKEMKVHCRQLENRSRKIVMDRRWIQAVFYLPQQRSQLRADKVDPEVFSTGPLEIPQQVAQSLESSTSGSLMLGKILASNASLENIVEENITLNTEESIVDLTEGYAAELFGGAPAPELLEVAIGSYIIHAKCLPKENQHTYASTGFMLWESAYAFGELLAANPGLIKGKSVLELGCGSVGLCSLMSSVVATRVVATDGDVGTLSLLLDNLVLNKANFAVGCITCHKLKWGNKDDIDTVRAASNGSGYQLIIGTDVTYVREAVPFLFETARALLVEPTKSSQASLFILCHRIRRVAESDITSLAMSHGFHVVGLWDTDVPLSSKPNKLESMKHCYVESLFTHGLTDVAAKYKALQVMCLSPKAMNEETIY